MQPWHWCSVMLRGFSQSVNKKSCRSLLHFSISKKVITSQNFLMGVVSRSALFVLSSGPRGSKTFHFLVISFSASIFSVFEAMKKFQNWESRKKYRVNFSLVGIFFFTCPRLRNCSRWPRTLTTTRRKCLWQCTPPIFRSCRQQNKFHNILATGRLYR